MNCLRGSVIWKPRNVTYAVLCQRRGTSIRSNAVPLQCRVASIGRMIDDWAGTDTEGSSCGLDDMQYRYLRGRTEETQVIPQDSRWYVKDLGGRIILSRSLGRRVYEAWIMIVVTSELWLAALIVSSFAAAVFINIVNIKFGILTKNLLR